MINRFKLLFFFILSCVSCLYILDINLLPVLTFVNIFSYFVGFLFILSMVSFTVQMLLSLIRFHLFIFAFISFPLRDRSKEIVLQFMSKVVLSMFSSRSFIVSYLIRSSQVFEFISVYGVRKLNSL